MRTGRLAALAVALTSFAACNSGHAENWTPDPALIQRIEKQLVLPPGTKPLEAYTRYYWGTASGERRILGGTFLYRFGEAAGVRNGSEADVPQIKDGGCAVVHLEYDIQDGRTVSIFCNGEA
jgi:hypothetical protein